MIDKLGQTGVVCRGEGHKGDFIVAGVLDEGIGDFLQTLFTLLTDRTIDHSGLTEAAAAAAAAEHFQDGTIMHDLDMREDRLVIDVDMVDITDDTLLHRELGRFVDGTDAAEDAILIVRDLIEGRRIAAIDLSETADRLLAAAGLPFRFPCFHDIHHLSDGFFGFSDEEDVEEISDRLCIVHTGAAGDNERILVCAILRPDRNACHVDHVQDIRVAHFIRHGEAKYIEVLDRAFAFKRKERNMLLSHHRFHVHPWRIHALCQRILSGIQDTVDDLESQMAHGDFVDIRECQRHFHRDLIVVFHHTIPLSANVAGRLLDMHQPYGIDSYTVHLILLK